MRKHHTAPAREFGFSDEPFALVAETATDGARLEKERHDREIAEQLAGLRQLGLLKEVEP